MATLDAPEQPATDTETWKWEKSQSGTSGWTTIDGGGVTDAYPPTTTTVGYYLRATATYKDADGTERTAAAVSANKVREAPAANAAAAFPDDPADVNNRDVAENSPAGTNVGKPVKANDTSDEVLTYSLTDANTGGFQINPATGQITVGPRTVLDHEPAPTYTVMVTVTEAGGTTETQSVTIAVTDVNEAPSVLTGATMVELSENYNVETAVSAYTASDPEDAAGDLVLTLQGADASKFNIAAAGGTLTFREIPNYEMPADAGRNNVYNVTVVATDNATGVGGKMTARREVTIMVTNLDELGMVTLSAQQPYVGVALTASVTDPDGAVTDVTWKWERDDDRADGENNDDEEVIAGATSATYTPTSDDISDDDTDIFLRAIASYTDPQGKGKTSDITSVAGVEVRTDNAPKFLVTESGRRMVAENQDVPADVVDDDTGTDTGDPVRATDADGGLLTYRLSGTDAGSFTIASDLSAANLGGLITTKSKLDYEAKSTYKVTVTATDADNLSGSIDVTITVTDVNEMPEVTGDAAKDYPENQTRDVATYRATDPEGGTIYWSLLTALPSAVPVVDGAALVDADFEDNADFSISADGVLTFNIRPDHEAPVDVGLNNVYNIVVVASDDAPGAGTAEETQMGYMKVVVTVTDVDEPGKVTLSSLQPQADVSLTATLDAPEQSTTDTETWKWEKSRSRTSGWTTIDDAGSANTYLPTTATGSYYLRATATYKDADGTERTAAAVSATECGRRLLQTPQPAFPDDPADVNNRDVAENSPAGTNVGKPVKANDTSGEVLTYSLTDQNTGGFEIDPVTAQITVGPRTVLDHEPAPDLHRHGDGH